MFEHFRMELYHIHLSCESMLHTFCGIKIDSVYQLRAAIVCATYLSVCAVWFIDVLWECRNNTLSLAHWQPSISLFPCSRKFQTQGADVEFTCQHGPNECYGNKVHACAIQHIQVSTKTFAISLDTWKIEPNVLMMLLHNVHFSCIRWIHTRIQIHVNRSQWTMWPVWCTTHWSQRTHRSRAQNVQLNWN